MATTGQFDSADKLVIYRDTADVLELQFVTNDGNDTPVDLSSFAPFIMEVRAYSDGPLLLSINVDDSNASTGFLLCSWTRESTRSLPIGQANIGMIDSGGRLWLEDTCQLKSKTPR